MAERLVNRFISVVSSRHGKVYVSLVATHSAESEPPIVAINGPFVTEQQADKWLRKWNRALHKHAKTGQAVRLSDAGAAVPPDVRTYITASLQELVFRHGVDGLEENRVYSNVLQ
jgi:hypothetical protein